MVNLAMLRCSTIKCVQLYIIRQIKKLHVQMQESYRSVDAKPGAGNIDVRRQSPVSPLETTLKSTVFAVIYAHFASCSQVLVW